PLSSCPLEAAATRMYRIAFLTLACAVINIYARNATTTPTCEGYACPTGETCFLHQLKCSTPPCTSVALCIPSSGVDPHCTLSCPAGQKCALQDVNPCHTVPCFKEEVCKSVVLNGLANCVLSCEKGEMCVYTYTEPLSQVCTNVAKQPCYKNEVWDTTYNGCARTCQATMLCTVHDGAGGCVCKEGFMRDDQMGSCVPKNECPNAQDTKSIII
ncbi:hypothetical protein PFISCL1PPCAC_26044, partial [Pristionchus fissidentatus]